MIEGFATKDGTERFRAKFSDAKEDFFSTAFDLRLSSLGIGTYVGEPYKEENYTFSYEQSVAEAVRHGCNHIDTAINYRYQASEREIGRALNTLVNDGSVARDELFIASKAGFIPLDYPFPKNPFAWIRENLLDAGLATDGDIALDQHCITPDYLRWSIERSLSNLGVESLDVAYLHNPEMQLGLVDYQTFLKKVRDAFEMFEFLADHGKIKRYGVATWNAFLNEPTHMEYIRLADLVRIAREVGGENHRFGFVQMPYNLGKPHAYSYTNQQLDDSLFYTPVQAARKLGLHVVTSSSLLQTKLFKAPFSSSIRERLGLEYASDLQRALQFARSAPGVTTALVGTSNVEHAIHDFELRRFAKTDPKMYETIFAL